MQLPKKVKIISQEKRRRRRIFFGIIATVVVLIIIFAISYFFFIPRVNVSIKTVFNETIGGSILVQVKISNLGTVEIKNISLTIAIYKINETKFEEKYDTFIIKRESTFESVPVWYYSIEEKRDVYFIEDQFAKYRLIISISFKTDKNAYSEKYTYIAKDYAFLFWEEKIQKLEV